MIELVPLLALFFSTVLASRSVWVFSSDLECNQIFKIIFLIAHLATIILNWQEDLVILQHRFRNKEKIAAAKSHGSIGNANL